MTASVLTASSRAVSRLRTTGKVDTPATPAAGSSAVQLMADRRSGRELTGPESLKVLREVLPEAFRRTHVLLRGDDRGATMLMVAPPLVADHGVLSELLHGVDAILTDVEKALLP